MFQLCACHSDTPQYNSSETFRNVPLLLSHVCLCAVRFDGYVFPFIYSDADDLVWVRKYVGDCSTCIEGHLYVKDMVTGEVKEIVSDAVKQLRESEDTLYCITNDGLSIIQTDCQGEKVTKIYKADYGMIDHLEVYGNNLCFTEGDYVVSFDLKKSEKTVVGRGANVLYLYPCQWVEKACEVEFTTSAPAYTDITISAEDLNEILILKNLSDHLMKRIHGNYRFIVGFNTGLIVLGVAGVIAPTTSALLHNTSTLMIGLNSMKDMLPEL